MSDQTVTAAPEDLNAKIDNLDMTEGMKAKMRLVHEHFVSMGLWPKYDVKGTKVWPLVSLWAFFFSAFYYLVKGIWRKALSLFLVGLIINILIVVIAEMFRINLPPAFSSLGSVFIAGISMQSAYYDIYRSKVLKQKFWW